MAQGKNNLFADPTLKEIGEKYGKTAAQINLRFLIQSGVVVIPKSTHKERMEENFNLFDFSLTEDEMKRLEEMDLGHRPVYRPLRTRGCRYVRQRGQGVIGKF